MISIYCIDYGLISDNSPISIQKEPAELSRQIFIFSINSMPIYRIAIFTAGANMMFILFWFKIG